MKRTFLIFAATAIIVLMVGSVVALPPVADQPVAADLQVSVRGFETQAMAAFRLDKTCERGNTRCR